MAQTFAIGIVNVNWREQISDGGSTYPRKSVPRGDTFTGTPAKQLITQDKKRT